MTIQMLTNMGVPPAHSHGSPPYRHKTVLLVANLYTPLASINAIRKESINWGFCAAIAVDFPARYLDYVDDDNTDFADLLSAHFASKGKPSSGYRSRYDPISDQERVTFVAVKGEPANVVMLPCFSSSSVDAYFDDIDEELNLILDHARD